MRARTGVGGRVALAGTAVLALLSVVALASRGGLGGGRGHLPAAPSASFLSYAFSLLLVLMLIAAPFAVWVLVVGRREDVRLARRRRGGFLRSLVVFAAFVWAALAIGAIRHAHGPQPTRRHVGVAAVGSGRTRTRSPAEAQPTFRWSVVVGVGVVALLAGGAYLVRRRRLEPQRPLPVAAELSLALDAAIDDVEAEADPRRAVIRAYARTESVLGAHGLPRRPPETPYEYLARALGALDASAASVARLTELYERARFSLHEIDAGMRGEAVGALAAVRDELRAAT